MKPWRMWLPFPTLCAALVLMILPIGYLMVFMPGPDERRIVAFSWFDGTLWGYGHPFPLPAAVLAAVSLVLFLVSRFAGRCGRICLGTLIFSAVLAVLALFTATAWNGWSVATVVLLVMAAMMQAIVCHWEIRNGHSTLSEKGIEE